MTDHPDRWPERPAWFVWLLVGFFAGLLVGCTSSTEATAPLTPAQAEAEAQADQCAARFQSPRRYLTLRYDTRPGLSFRVQGLEVVGWGREGRVTVAAAYADAVPLLAHEVLHAAYGWVGGLNRQPHDPRFALCQLWPLAPVQR